MPDPEKYNNAMRYASLGAQWLVMLLVAVWGGIKLDAWIGWKFPLFTIVLPLFALCLSLWLLIKELNKPKK
jgi:hypothetical protein